MLQFSGLFSQFSLSNPYISNRFVTKYCWSSFFEAILNYSHKYKDLRWITITWLEISTFSSTYFSYYQESTKRFDSNLLKHAIFFPRYLWGSLTWMSSIKHRLKYNFWLYQAYQGNYHSWFMAFIKIRYTKITSKINLQPVQTKVIEYQFP
jgi:hypothetical protein